MRLIPMFLLCTVVAPFAGTAPAAAAPRQDSAFMGTYYARLPGASHDWYGVRILSDGTVSTRSAYPATGWAGLNLKGRINDNGTMRIRGVENTFDGTNEISINATVSRDVDGNIVGVTTEGSTFIWDLDP